MSQDAKVLDYASPRVPEPVRIRSSLLKFAVFWLSGNLWLLVTVALYVGRRYERGSPTRYSFVGMGNWFTPVEYMLVVVLTLAMGVACIVIGVRAGRNL